MVRKFIVSLIFISFLLIGEKQAMAQEFPWLLQYVSNLNSINPAYVGIWDRAEFMVTTRNNWVGISGSPLFQHFSCYGPIRDMKSGIGLNIQRLNVGQEKRIYITGDYSYQVRLNMAHYLRFGLRAGFANFTNNLTDYQLYPDRITDPYFSIDVKLYYMSIFGLGALYFNENYYISLSVPQIISNTFSVKRNIYSSFQEFNNIYLSGGYAFKLIDGIRLRPNLLLVGTPGKSIKFDAAAVLYLPADLQLGFNLRSTGSVCLSAQYTIVHNLKIGFAVEYAIIRDIRNYQMGTFELAVGYYFNQKKGKDMRPRYF